jgi:hypothetical protein
MPNDERPVDEMRFRRESVGSDGVASVFQHNLPNVLTHLYMPRGIDKEIPLYRGSFEVVDDEDGSSRRCDGDVRLCWRPTPKLLASGTTAATVADPQALLAVPEGIWAEWPHLVVPSGTEVPRPPDDVLDVQARKVGTALIGPTPFEPYEHGDPGGLDRITALVPNGWAAHDAMEVVDPHGPGGRWPARTTAQSDDWHLAIDEARASIKELRKALRRQGGYGVTHVLELRRIDGAIFHADEATRALDAIGDALGLFLGRRSAPLLPVGWRGTTPVWAAWRPVVIDPYQEHGSWRDDTIASAQLASLLAGYLRAWRDPLRRDTPALCHRLLPSRARRECRGRDRDRGLGLLVLVEGWIVQELQRKLNKATEPQIRGLLEHCSIDPAMPVAFAELAKVQAALIARNKKARDGLECLIAMRNDVVHPTPARQRKWSTYQWAEARMLAVHYLELAMLCYVGYDGQYHPRTSARRYVGEVEDVPWK